MVWIIGDGNYRALTVFVKSVHLWSGHSGTVIAHVTAGDEILSVMRKCN